MYNIILCILYSYLAIANCYTFIQIDSTCTYVYAIPCMNGKYILDLPIYKSISKTPV